MYSLNIPARFIALVSIMALALQAGTAPANGKATKTIPATITTEKGVTYESAKLVSFDPEGLVIDYKPDTGGMGLAKLKFENLPESLRQEFNYDRGAAEDFAADREKAMEQWRSQPAEVQEPKAAAEKQAMMCERTEMAASSQQPAVGRFRAAATIRGAMILDSVTGEAWLVDLHSTLEDYKDRSYFFQPKVALAP